MAEEKKKSAYDALVEALASSGLTDEQIAKAYPQISAWWKAAADRVTREKALGHLLADPKMQKELMGWDAFKNFDFANYEEPEDLTIGLKDAPMKQVDAWYSAAKKAIDPTNRLGDAELWETAGAPTFEQLEDKVGADYEGDWFGKVLDALGYPDTPDGYEQLAQDMNTVLTRKKNAAQAKKYPAGMDILFGNSMARMKKGYKPTVADMAGDDATLAAMMIPWGNVFAPFAGASKAARVGNSVVSNAVAPTLAELTRAGAEFVNGASNPVTEEEGVSQRVRNGLENIGRGADDMGQNILTGTLVNIFGPMKKGAKLIGSKLPMLENNGLSAKESAELAQKLAYEFPEWFAKQAPILSTFIDNKLGNSQVAKRLSRSLTGQLNSWFVGNGDEEEY